MSIRNRTHSSIIGYGLYLYFLGLSFRNAAKALSFLKITKIISHVSIWNWLQKYRPWKYFKKRKIKEYVIDETMIKARSELIWLWVVIESENKNIVAINISKERNMFITERFLDGVTKEYGRHPVSTNGGTWYPQACRFLNIEHHLHSHFEKSIIKRTIQYIKDRTECFDDYFPCRKQRCKLNHVKQWMNMFAYYYNREIIS